MLSRYLWLFMVTHFCIKWLILDTGFPLQTYAEMDPTTAALEKEHEAVSWSVCVCL